MRKQKNFLKLVNAFYLTIILLVFFLLLCVSWSILKSAQHTELLITREWTKCNTQEPPTA